MRPLAFLSHPQGPQMPWAIVTASSRGVGYTIAEALAEKGYSLIVTSRYPEERGGVVEALESRGAPRAVMLRLNLTREESLKGFIEEAGRIVGCELRVLAVNFGNPSCEPCSLSQASWRDWIEAASMYLAATAELLRFAAGIGGVRVIVVSSFTTSELHPYLIVSDAARRGLDALVKAAAHEYPGRVYTVLLQLGSFKTPGAVETLSKIAGLEGSRFEEYWEREVEARSPLKRSGGFEELKAIVKFLAEAPEYLTGSKIVFDGASSRVYI